jgi:predicted GH43/DUF377 family glycosyl hydrolase
VTEPGPPPVLTREGILLIYNGADENLVYCTGWAIFDRKDPAHLLARSDKPLLQPEEKWEKAGQVPNVVFVEGLVRNGTGWLFYYGGADKYVGVARAAPQRLNRVLLAAPVFAVQRPRRSMYNLPMRREWLA